MTKDKRLVGVYLPFFLIARLKIFISGLYKKGVTKTQSEVIEDALTTYLDCQEDKKNGN